MWASTHSSPGSLLAFWGHLSEVTNWLHTALKGPGALPRRVLEKSVGHHFWRQPLSAMYVPCDLV